MLNFKIVKNYADAFYTAMFQQKEQAYEEFLQWGEVLKQNPLVTQFMNNSTVETKEKKKIFQSIIPSHFITKKLFDIIIDNNKGVYWKAIIDAYIQKYKHEEGIVDVKVTSSVKLQDEDIDKIEKFIKQKYNYKKVNINNTIDTNIIGGVILSFDGIQIDYSLKTILQKMKL